MLTPWTPTSALGQIVYVAGFLYDPTQDIIYSRIDALQYYLGYGYMYDATAIAAINAVIDCEPIFFTANNKMWMIELWKGQYGLETGCEIGIYTRPTNPPAYYSVLDALIGARNYDPSHSYFYQCADQQDWLVMSFTLKRNGVPLFTRDSKDSQPGTHWWLTGFKWGVYSTPDELSMDISIDIPDANILSGFTATLKSMSYQFAQNGSTVNFEFSKPYAPQPWTNAPGLATVQALQQTIVNTYQSFHLTNSDPNNLPAALAFQIGSAVLGKVSDIFGKLASSFLLVAGKSASEVVAILTNSLGAPIQAALNWTMGTITVRRSTGNDFGPGYQANEDWSHGPCYGSRGTFFADVDGDGKPDCILVGDNTITVRRSTGHDFGASWQLANEDWTHGPYCGNKGTMFADVTGDRKADAIVVNG